MLSELQWQCNRNVWPMVSRVKKCKGLMLSHTSAPCSGGFVGKIVIDGVELTLMPPVKTDDKWIDYSQYLQQLQAAWLTLSNVEPPLNPRLIGEPGLGKTTLACAVARELKGGRRLTVQGSSRLWTIPGPGSPEPGLICWPVGRSARNSTA